MKRLFASILPLVLLVSTLSGALLVKSATANFIGLEAAHVRSAKFLVGEPLNNSVCKASDIDVRFSFELSGWIPSPDDQKHYLGGVYPPNIKSSIMCFLDGRLVWQRSELYSLSNFNFAFSLSELPHGLHNLTFRSETSGDFFYGTYSSDPLWGGWSWDRVNSHYSSCAIFFTAETPPPIIQILSVEQQQVFDVSDVPLRFSVSEPFSWLGYSLDGQDNVTITGNTTLTGLTEGTHSLFVYANDSFGQTARSLIRYFTIAESSSFTTPFPMMGIAVAIIASVAIISFGLAAYFAKFKRKRNII
jgi:hypothetical protein